MAGPSVGGAEGRLEELKCGTWAECSKPGFSSPAGTGFEKKHLVAPIYERYEAGNCRNPAEGEGGAPGSMKKEKEILVKRLNQSRKHKTTVPHDRNQQTST